MLSRSCMSDIVWCLLARVLMTLAVLNATQGQVSIMAHSLGSVLCYDILCNQPGLFAALQRPPPSVIPPQEPQPKRPRHAPSDAQVPCCLTTCSQWPTSLRALASSAWQRC